MLLLALVGAVQGLYAQSGSTGSSWAAAGTEVAIVATHNFQTGSGTISAGIIGSERTAPIGIYSFLPNSSHTGASDNGFVDGYVRTYKRGAFTFPIGDNAKYRPVAISSAYPLKPAEAAYFGTDPATATTSSLKGGNEPALPTGAPFSTTALAGGLLGVSNIEYWDINGTSPAQITLTWDATSAISTLTSGSLSNLCIVGWDGSKWVKIPSAVDATSLLGGASSLTGGSITTTGALVPNAYTVYTFGRQAVANLSIAVSPATATGNKGELLTYTATITNAGPDVATNVKINSWMPTPTATVQSATASLGTYSSLTNQWSIASLPVGTATLTFTVKVN